MSDTNEIPQIPNTWTSARLGEIAISFTPGFPSGKHNKDGRGVPHLRPMNVTSKGEISLSDLKYVEESDYQPLGQGDILFNNTNSPALLGKTSYIRHDTNWAYSNHMTRIKVLQEALNPAWVAYSLHHLFLTGYFQSNCTNHVNQASINTGFLFERVQIPIPPLPEQHRIVAKIEELFTKLDAGVEALRTARAQLRRYRQSVLKAAVTGELTKGWREAHRGELEPASELLARILREHREEWEANQLAKLKAAGKTPKNDDWKKSYKEPELMKLRKSAGLPEGWAWASVEQLNPFDRPCAYGVLQPGDDVEGGTLFVRVGDINNGRIDMSGLKRIAPKIASAYPRTRLYGGEVLITLVGAIGRTAVVPSTLIGANTARAVGVIPLTEQISAHWVEIWFRNPDKVYEMTSLSHEVARKTLNLEDVRAASVVLPPLREQAFIVSEVGRLLSIADATERAIEQSLKQAERLRQSILKQAFEGKLVPQDPADEPAEVLLTRIREERAKGDAARPKKGKPRGGRKSAGGQIELLKGAAS